MKLSRCLMPLAWGHSIGLGRLGGVMACVLMAMAATAATDASGQKSASENGRGPSSDAFVVFGKVTEASGKPLSGVEIVANCGIGTLFPTGRAVSGADGEYRLVFGPGMLMGRLLKPGPLGVGFQVATISARKSGYSSEGLGRKGNLAMTDLSNAAPNWSTNFAGVVKAFEPYRLDFQLQPAASIHGTLLDPAHKLPQKASLCLTGKHLPPSSSALACVDLANNREFEFKDVPVGKTWWFELSWREGDGTKTLRSRSFLINSPAPKTVTLKVLAGELAVTGF